MALSNEEIIEAIGQKTVLEIVELIKAMEEKFGVSAAAAGPLHRGRQVLHSGKRVDDHPDQDYRQK